MIFDVACRLKKLYNQPINGELFTKASIPCASSKVNFIPPIHSKTTSTGIMLIHADTSGEKLRFISSIPIDNKAKYLITPWPEPITGKPPMDAIHIESLSNEPKGIMLIEISKYPNIGRKLLCFIDKKATIALTIKLKAAMKLNILAGNKSERR